MDLGQLGGDLQRLGLAEVEEYDMGQGMKKYLGARWGLHTTYYWEQTFPAGATTTIEPRYKPSGGMTGRTSFSSRALSSLTSTRSTRPVCC